MSTRKSVFFIFFSKVPLGALYNNGQLAQGKKSQLN